MLVQRRRVTSHALLSVLRGATFGPSTSAAFSSWELLEVILGARSHELAMDADIVGYT